MYKKLYQINIKYLIENRAHIGHLDKKLNKNMNFYLQGFRQNISIFNTTQLWYSFKYLFHNISEMFLKRNTFFLIGTNPRLPIDLLLKKWLRRYSENSKKINFFYISGYIDKKWIEGLFTNWKIFYKYIHAINRNLILGYKYERYFPFLQGITFLKKNAIPDFIIMFDNDSKALHEIKNLQIPLIGFVDTDMNPNDYILKFYGNNDSRAHVNFFFQFFRAAACYGRLKEQQLFFYYLVLKIKKKIHDKKQ